MDPSYYGLTNNNNLFNFVSDKQSKEFLLSAHHAISSCELWDWLRNNTIKSFMFNNSPELTRLQKAMDKDEINGYHSGTSFGFVLRQMEFIAKNGYEYFRQRTQ